MARDLPVARFFIDLFVFPDSSTGRVPTLSRFVVGAALAPLTNQNRPLEALLSVYTRTQPVQGFLKSQNTTAQLSGCPGLTVRGVQARD